MKLLARTRRPNLINLCEWAESSFSYYFVVEFCPYGTLSQEIQRRSEGNEVIEEPAILEFAKELLSGLEVLHSNNIVHE